MNPQSWLWCYSLVLKMQSFMPVYANTYYIVYTYINAYGNLEKACIVPLKLNSKVLSSTPQVQPRSGTVKYSSSSSEISILGFLWGMLDLVGLHEFTLVGGEIGSWGTSAAARASWGSCSPKRPMSASHSNSPNSSCSFCTGKKQEGYERTLTFERQCSIQQLWHQLFFVII